MSYPTIGSPTFLEDLLRRKEYYSLRIDPDRNFRDPNGQPDPLASKHLKLHSHQLFDRNFLSPNTNFLRLHLLHVTGCHAAGTKIMMYSGRLQNVEDIIVGNRLMGDDGQPREVLGLARGRETMYKVICDEPFVCNAHHILSLRKNGHVIDISIIDYIACRQAGLLSEYKLFRACTNFAPRETTMNPYVHGRWLGRALAGATPGDIDDEYLYNCREKRLELLAGILDAAGRNQKNSWQYEAVSENAINNIVYLARSLGFSATKFPLLASWRLVIEGKLSDIPTLQAPADTVLSDRDFTLEQLAEDDYYGFEIGNNHRYLLGCFTVTHNTGKTLAAVTIAQSFADVYKKLYAAAAAKIPPSRRNYAELDKITPSIFVFGFSAPKAAFVRELLRYTEFGFISTVEKEELARRYAQADSGLPDDIRNLKEYYSLLKKRITNKSRGGFYKFYGYDEFVNRLFISDEVKLTDLEAVTLQKNRSGQPTNLEDVIKDYISKGKIRVNQQLMAMFENSLLICDEIHNTYNMNMKNNRGVAIQFLLDSVSTMRFLSLSATPTNNSPTEVVELVNYLVPKEQKITKREFFASNRHPLPGKIEEIGRLTRGRISFLQDSNIKYFPKRTFIGTDIILSHAVDSLPAGSTIPYLKFIECPMSELHQATYNNYVADNNDMVDSDDDGESTRSIPTDGYSIYDIALPNPESETIGIFRSHEVKQLINSAPQEWRDQMMIYVKKFSAANSVLTGDFLRRDNICKYSAKYAMLIDVIMSIIGSFNGSPGQCQKMMIYHDRVKMSGVLMIQELLRVNGFVDEHSEPTDSTLCCICGHVLHGHKGDHDYLPTRFVMAHSDMDKATMEQSIAKYNSPDNAHGLKYMILVGSKIIKESYDFKDVQNLIITSLPTNIPTAIQVIGRCVRKNSHLNLPPEQRQVNIRILVSVVNDKFPAKDPISPEVYRYIDKILDYQVIQQIEREFNRNAVDANIHRDIIMSADLRAAYFPGNVKEPVNMLGNLYFEPAIDLPNYTKAELVESTFVAYKYYEEEIRTITYIIKRLFIAQPVWTYDDLYVSIRQPPFGIEVNPKLFSEGNFIIALHNLVNLAQTIMSPKRQGEITESMLIDRLFDASERYIYVDGRRHKIEHIGKYYVLFPIGDSPANILNVVYAEYLEHTRDKERAMIKDLAETSDRALIDAESYLRRVTQTPGMLINIDKFMQESRAGVNYLAKKAQFMAEYAGRDDVMNFILDYPAPFQMAFLEDAIQAGLTPGADEIYGKIIALLDKFQVIIYMRDVIKYRDTGKQFEHGLPDLPAATPIGYTNEKTIKLFDPEASRWIEISKAAMNKHTTYKENEVIIGYLESADDRMRFKLRKPMHKIKDDLGRGKQVKPESNSEVVRLVGDTRLIERGIVCNTKGKRDLLQIIAALGISTSKLDKTEIRIRRLCKIIQNKLIENEIKERQRDSRYKYLYSWWTEQVNLAAIV